MRERLTEAELDAVLDRALRAVQADADPRALARAFDALDRRPTLPALPAWLNWGMRPQALAASFAVLAVTAAFAWTLETGSPAAVVDDPAALAAAIETEVEGTLMAETRDENVVPSDSGEVL